MKTGIQQFIALILIISASFSFSEKQVTKAKSKKKASSKAITEEVVKRPNPVYQVETTMGNFTIELFANEAPETVANFVGYIKEGFYDDTIFHRIVPGFVIQGGGFDEKLAKKKTKKPIKNESSEKLTNTKGTLSMARLKSPDTATSQFFINLQDNTSLNKNAVHPGYAVFGRVTEGMHIIERMGNVPTGKSGIYQNVPKTPIKVIRIKPVDQRAQP